MNLSIHTLKSIFLLLTIAAPLFGFIILTLRALIFNTATERIIALVARSSFVLSIFSLVGLLILLTFTDLAASSDLVLPWFKVGTHRYDISFASDNFSLSFLALIAILGGLASVFSETYLHQERGYERFYILLLLATFGMNLVVAANSLSLMVIGWSFWVSHLRF